VKRPAATATGKAQFFIIPQIMFPDLTEIDKCVTKGLAHPHIPILELQQVAVNVCGMPLEEVN
jgi:hypothetical protein